jgi:predicted PhzF superfamily epimerase YddE/YHI9
LPRPPSSPVSTTSPSRIAASGVPASANTSWPSCRREPRHAPKRASYAPNSIVPRIGNQVSGSGGSISMSAAVSTSVWKVAPSEAGAPSWADAWADAAAAMNVTSAAIRAHPTPGPYPESVPTLHLLRVFCGEQDAGGNPLGVFLEGAEVPSEARQGVAAELALPETVFVDDAALGRVRIFTPAVELDFAGHPTVGTAWLLRERGIPVSALHVQAGEAAVRYEDGDAFVAGRPEWGPPWELRQLDSPAAVEALDGPPDGHDLVSAWAWLDEGAGVVRARVFGPRVGVDEDEATGSAAVRLCSALARPLDIRQGRASRILARPLDGGRVEIGGRSVLDDERDYS